MRRIHRAITKRRAKPPGRAVAGAAACRCSRGRPHVLSGRDREARAAGRGEARRSRTAAPQAPPGAPGAPAPKEPTGCAWVLGVRPFGAYRGFASSLRQAFGGFRSRLTAPPRGAASRGPGRSAAARGPGAVRENFEPRPREPRAPRLRWEAQRILGARRAFELGARLARRARRRAPEAHTCGGAAGDPVKIRRSGSSSYQDSREVPSSAA